MIAWLARHGLGVSAANSIKFSEQGRSSFSIGVEKNVFEQGSHKVKIVEAKSAGVCFFCQEKDDLSEVISNKAFVRVARKASEGEAN